MDQKTPSEIGKDQSSSQGTPSFGSSNPPITNPSTDATSSPASVNPLSATSTPSVQNTPNSSFGSIGNAATPSESSPSSPAAGTTPPPPSISPASPPSDNPVRHGPNVVLLAGIVILVIAVLGGAFFLAMMQSTPTPAPVEVPPTATAAPSPTSTLPSPSSAVSNTTGDSNEQLQKDTQTIEASITGVANDESAIDEGLTDQQTELTQ